MVRTSRRTKGYLLARKGAGTLGHELCRREAWSGGFTEQAGSRGYPEQDEFLCSPSSVIREAEMKVV